MAQRGVVRRFGANVAEIQMSHQELVIFTPPTTIFVHSRLGRVNIICSHSAGLCVPSEVLWFQAIRVGVHLSPVGTRLISSEVLQCAGLVAGHLPSHLAPTPLLRKRIHEGQARDRAHARTQASKQAHSHTQREEKRAEGGREQGTEEASKGGGREEERPL